MRERFFLWVTKISIGKPWIVIISGLLLTLIMGFFASKLRLEMTWYGIVPKNHPALKSYKMIVDKLGNEGGILIGVENPSPDSLLNISEEVVDSLAPYKKFFKDIVLKEPEGFFLKHGLMLVDSSLIKRVSKMLASANLDSFLFLYNNDLEGEYIEKEENLEAQELEATMSLSSLEDFLYGIRKYLANGKDKFLNLGIKELVTGPLYFKSLDNRMILISILPRFTFADLKPMKNFVETERAIIKRIAKRHSDTRIFDTGIYSIGRDEYVTGMRDSNVFTVVSFILVVLLFFLGFRLLQAPILAGIPLVFGIIWDLGLTELFIGRLNLMTVLVAAILLGLGIDYSIHLLQASAEEGGVKTALLRVGNGIVIGALTTAAAFFSLTATSYDVLKELGVVMGMGVLTTATATIFILPALIKLFGKSLQNKDLRASKLGAYAERIKKRGFVVPVILIVLLILSPLAIKRIKTVANPIALEAPGLHSVANQDTVVERFGMSTDYIMVPSKSPHEVDSLARVIKKIPGVSFTEGIQLYCPPDDLQRYKLTYLKGIHERTKGLKVFSPDKKLLLVELKRLKDNIIELKSMAYIGGLDKVYRKCDRIIKNQKIDLVMDLVRNTDKKTLNQLNSFFFSRFKTIILSASTPEMISLDDVPRRIKRRYISSDGSLFVLNVYSRKDVWSDIGGGAVMDRLLEVAPVTGMPILMRVLWKVGKKESRKALIIVFVTIFLILLLDFRNLKEAILAFLPVGFAFVFTLALMGIIGVPFNIINVLALPLIIGIGIDDAVHIIHRYLDYPSVSGVFTRIGRAILYTSLTTMAAFGSLLLGKYRGYPTFGAVVLIGVALAFLTTIHLLPPLLKFLKRGDK